VILLKETTSTPFVHISADECIFSIKGFSFANEIDNFYKPIMEYIDREFPKLNCELNCEIYLSVFNSVTYKYILEMMSKFIKFNNEGKQIKITWYYDIDDEDNIESAKDINTIFNIPFELKIFSK